MKKGKYNLFLSVGIVVLISMLLTWVFPSAYYEGGKLVVDNGGAFNLFATTAADSKVGLFDLFTYGFLPFRYFGEVFIFVLAVAGFYKFLGTLQVYAKMTDKIAKCFSGKEILFVGISMFIFGALSAIVTNQMILFALIPFAISVLAKLKVDKVTGLSATFGGTLIGIAANLYSTNIAGQMASTSSLSVAYGDNFFVLIISALVAYLLLMTFVVLRNIKGNDKEELVDIFASNVDVSKAKANKAADVLFKIFFAVTIIILVMAFIGWAEAFNIQVFEDAYTWIKESTIFGTTAYSNILGTVFTSFGNWDLYAASSLIIMFTLLVKVLYRIPFAHIMDAFGAGVKKIGKAIPVLMAIYLVLEIQAIFPRIGGVASYILGTTPANPNALGLFGSGVLASIFSVDFAYLNSFVGSVFALFSDAKAAAIILQFAYGFAMFVAPTSIMLMLGLSVCDVKYTEWFKSMWKFILTLLFAIVAVLVIITL